MKLTSLNSVHLLHFIGSPEVSSDPNMLTSKIQDRGRRPSRIIGCLATAIVMVRVVCLSVCRTQTSPNLDEIDVWLVGNSNKKQGFPIQNLHQIRDRKYGSVILSVSGLALCRLWQKWGTLVSEWRMSAKEFWRARTSSRECERVRAQREAARGNTAVIATFSSWFFALFLNHSARKASGVENRGKISHFFTSCKIEESWWRGL